LETEINGAVLTTAYLDHALVAVEHGFWPDGDELWGDGDLAVWIVRKGHCGCCQERRDMDEAGVQRKD